MIKSDLITKMIEQFLNSLTKIESLKGENKYEESIKVIDDTLSDIFRLNLKSFNSLQDEYLIEIIKVNNLIDSEKFIMVSILLQKEAEIIEINGDLNQSHLIFTKALSIILEAFSINDEPELLKFYSQIPILIDKINDYELPQKILLRLFKYYEETQNFAKSEDILYELLESKDKDITIVNLGISFYERLLKKDSATLEKGGLPSEEVQHGLNKLQI